MSGDVDQFSVVSGGSAAVQAGRDVTIHSGVSSAEVVRIFQTLYEINSSRLLEQASAVVETRVQELTESFVLRLDEAAHPVDALADPDVQHSVLAAQRAYARSGRTELRDTLTDLLVSRCAPRRTDFQKIALAEAVETVRVLTPGQIATLTTTWLVVRTQSGAVRSAADLAAFGDRHLAPFLDDLALTETDFEHLDFARCGRLGATPRRIATGLLKAAPGLFQKGYTADQLPTGGIFSMFFDELFEKSSTEPDQFQVRAVTVDQARARIKSYNPVFIDPYAALLTDGLMSEDEAEHRLSHLSPTWARLLSTWTASDMKNFSPTAVGIAIAHTNWARITGDNAPLSTWIP